MEQLEILKEIRDLTYQTLSTLRVNSSGASVMKLVEASYEMTVRQLDSIMNSGGSERRSLWRRRLVALKKDD